jgi:hypothetical protein
MRLVPEAEFTAMKILKLFIPMQFQTGTSKTCNSV